MMLYGGLWWFIVAYGGYGGYCGFWSFLMVYDGLWFMFFHNGVW